MTNDIKFDFNDVLIKPITTSKILSRSEIDIEDGNFMLPLITAPMDTVVDIMNAHLFERDGINVCLPRGEIGVPNAFTSFSLKEFKEKFLNCKKLQSETRILIDIANGHMSDLIEATREAKKIHGDNLVLMVGNVANPETYKVLSDAGADYIRVGIGNGGGCLTTQNTGVGYPMGSLIRECYHISYVCDKPAKIVADGGMKTYSDIIKALALGADYVMMGGILNATLESSGDNYLWKRFELPSELATKAYKLGLPIYKKFRGMSTKEVQKKWGVEAPKTSEGVTRYRKVEYTIPQWVENFKHYLSSAMSYSGAKSLEEFIGKADIIKITDNAYKRFNK